MTIIPDYRVLPNMKFPDPLVDIKDALTFIVNNSSQINAGSPVQADTDAIFVMGHSAGAAITLSTFVYPGLVPASVKAHVRALILGGGLFHANTSTPALPPDTWLAYFGSEEAVRENSPYALLQKASDEEVKALPEVFTLVSEDEVPAMLESNEDVKKVLRERTGREVHESVLKGHSHVSPHYALYTGQGEQWGEEVADWVKARAGK